MRIFIRSYILLLFLALSQSGCVFWSLFLGTATVAGGTILTLQERSLGNSVDDTAILIKINKDLLKIGLFSRVKIKVSEGRVLLMGEVLDLSHKIAAERIAWHQRGVKEVINEITLKADGSKILSVLTDGTRDNFISTQIKLKIILDNKIKSVNYSINTISGVVYLMGISQDQKELNRVILIARRTKGVKQVVSYVRFKDSKLRG